MITANDLLELGWHHIATSANGGSKKFCNRGRENQNVLPLYLIGFHGDNFSMKKNNSPQLTEITIEEILVNPHAENRDEKIKTVIHYTGHPTLDEFKELIKKLP